MHRCAEGLSPSAHHFFCRIIFSLERGPACTGKPPEKGTLRPQPLSSSLLVAPWSLRAPPGTLSRPAFGSATFPANPTFRS